MNPGAIELLRSHIDRIDWFCLAYNDNDDAGTLFSPENVSDVLDLEDNWGRILQMPAIRSMLRQHPHLVPADALDLKFQQYDWIAIDYAAIARHNEQLCRSIVEEMHKPERVAKWLALGNELDDYLN
jgi:hypothetical protein